MEIHHNKGAGEWAEQDHHGQGDWVSGKHEGEVAVPSLLVPRELGPAVSWWFSYKLTLFQALLTASAQGLFITYAQVILFGIEDWYIIIEIHYDYWL